MTRDCCDREMFLINIKYPDGKEETPKLVPGTYRVGSSPASHIHLDRPEVSSQHCQIFVSEDSLRVADSDSSNGTLLDGRSVGSDPVEVGIGSIIRVGKVEIEALGPDMPDEISLPAPAGKKATPKPVDKKMVEMTSSIKAAKNKADKLEDRDIPILRVSGIPEKHRPFVQEIKKRAHFELLKRLNLKRLALSGASEDELAKKAASTIHDILSELSIPLPDKVKIAAVEEELVHEAIGLGPLEDLIAMEEITEIMVNGPNQVYVEMDGTLFRTDTAFADDHQVQAAIERIVSPLGRRIDESSPMVDARLKDGSRVNAIIPPLSLVGPSITIRKFSKTPFTDKDLISFNSFTEAIARFIEICVLARKNILISGGTGSGKTTLLNVVSNYLPGNERIVTIEDAAELQLGQEHVVRLESRPPNIEGKGQISIRDLVRNSLRMRPDRLVVGECRSGEALDMLQAMNTGHDGSLTTIHANSPRDALARLETLVLMAGFDLPLRAIREQIASAVSIVVQVERMKDGTRKLTKVSEITKMEGDIITMQDIFAFKHEGWSPEGKILGRHVACGSIPTFMEEIKRANIDIDISMFKDERGEGF